MEWTKPFSAGSLFVEDELALLLGHALTSLIVSEPILKESHRLYIDEMEIAPTADVVAYEPAEKPGGYLKIGSKTCDATAFGDPTVYNIIWSRGGS